MPYPKNPLRTFWKLYCLTVGTLSIIIALCAAVYLIKSDVLGINIFQQGGWHTFQKCLKTSFSIKDLS
ncbi:MAG: hypothetical protein COY40_02890 [Alphaproteobacteria bacterium CG_4_10_14_0_8_um_filter_53_9]|nr:MAG: hypothetical protein COY40_02890 [Alphaproteobacteria bacterium CG_4_10_14_0_8_um_filter_53_9]